MSAPAWCVALVRRLAPVGRGEEVVGDLVEAHGARMARRGPVMAHLLTALEALDMGRALLLERLRDGERGRKRLAAGGGPGVPGGRGRGPRWRPVVSILDFKLGGRMLLRYPGLTVLAGVAMAFAIFVGAGTYEVLKQVVRPDLGLPGGDRILGIRLWHGSSGSVEEQASFDLAHWRNELGAVEHLGAFQFMRRNLITAEGPGMSHPTARMSAAGFRVAGVPPALGRVLTDADEADGAEPVVVIGHSVWQRRFGGDPNVIGALVHLGNEPHTVVGVMPEGFAFPVAHELWIPGRYGTGTEGPREGPGLAVFGRLAEGVSLDQARTQLERLGTVLAAEYPATHEHIRPQVMPYARAVLSPPGSLSAGMISALLLSANLPILLFVILVAGNVALLLFARAASRESELVVRSALGASRTRIIAQLFIEALVLAGLAAMVGLAALGFGMRGLFAAVAHLSGSLPFWFQPRVGLETVLYTLVLTVLVAAVAGGLPGRKATLGISGRLKGASAGGGGFRFGGVWTALIVTQIAVMVNFPIASVILRSERAVELAEDLDFAGGDYLAVRLALDNAGGGAPDGATAAAERYATVLQRLDERLSGEPGVRAVTFTERLPRQYHPWRQIEVAGGAAPAPDERGHRMASSSVALDYFDVMGAPILAGRNFHTGDLVGPGVVIVNEHFADRVLDGRNPVGRRIRYLATEEYRDPTQEPGPWLEIVGVVPELGTRSGYGPTGIYHPVEPGAAGIMHAVVHVPGGAEDHAAPLRAAAAGVDPALRLDNLVTLDRVTDSTRAFYDFWDRLVMGVTAVSLLLSLGGIYAVLSFTVAQRTREIGIRMALGSSRRRMLAALFRRPLTQVVLGTGLGVAVLPSLYLLSGGGPPTLTSILLMVGYFLLMTAVCLTACVVPAARVLRVPPSQALRAEA